MNKSHTNKAKQEIFQKNAGKKNDDNYQSDITSFDDDVTTTDNDVMTTSDESDKATPKQGVRCKTPDPKQDLGATALVAIMEPVTENSSSGAPNSP
jgi:hypothetical protein